jgi:hypothetical protein
VEDGRTRQIDRFFVVLLALATGVIVDILSDAF